MPLDLEKDDESIPPDYSEEWINDIWDLSAAIVSNISRSMEEILELEYQIINTCTDLEPLLWINIYWKKFRDIMDVDSSWTISQIKRKLYIEK